MAVILLEGIPGLQVFQVAHEWHSHMLSIILWTALLPAELSPVQISLLQRFQGQLKKP